MVDLPNGRWVDEDNNPTPAFRQLLADIGVVLETEPETVEVTATIDDEQIAAFEGELTGFESDIDDLKTVRSFDTGSLSGSATYSIGHGLGTENVYHTVHRTAGADILSIEIIDVNTVEITSAAATTLQNVRIYTFDEET